MPNPLHLLAAAVRELRSEKRTRQISLRLSDSLVSTLDELADREGRDRGDYIARILESHCFGVVPSGMFRDSALPVDQFRASQRGALEDR